MSLPQGIWLAAQVNVERRVSVTGLPGAPKLKAVPAFSMTYPEKCPISPLNPVFLPFVAFSVLKRHGFNSINLTNST